MTTYHMDFEGQAGRGAGMQKLVNLSGALVSVALIGGAGFWGYELMVRDVTGVPVVQAMDGAFRVAPDDPGGMNAPHQGLSVNEIAAVGTAGGPAAEVTLAPPQSALAEDDKPQKVLEADAEAETKAAELAAAETEAVELEAAETEAAELAAAEIERDPDLAALTDPTDGASAIVKDALPEGALATDLAVMEALMGTSGYGEAQIVAASAEGAPDAATSPRPAPRPTDERRVASLGDGDGGTALAPAAATGPAEEVDAASLAPGTKMAQLGAFASPEVAREHWAEIAARFDDRFVGKRRVIQKAEAGGKTFWRLRAEGFADLAQSRRFCSALMAGAADCIPVELR